MQQSPDRPSDRRVSAHAPRDTAIHSPLSPSSEKPDPSNLNPCQHEERDKERREHDGAQLKRRRNRERLHCCRHADVLSRRARVPEHGRSAVSRGHDRPHDERQNCAQPQIDPEQCPYAMISKRPDRSKECARARKDLPVRSNSAGEPRSPLPRRTRARLGERLADCHSALGAGRVGWDSVDHVSAAFAEKHVRFAERVWHRFPR